MTENTTISTIIWLALSVPIVALLSGFINLFITEKFAWLSPLLSSILLLITTILSSILLFQSPDLPVSYQVPWIEVNNKFIHIGVLLTNQSIVMTWVVTLISFLVHLFSVGYMADDKDQVRYFGMLGFFTFAMLGLVLSSNLLITFCFWELVGFSSYRLIGHWYEKPSAASASTKAFLVNRIGDLGFLVGLMILWQLFGHLDIKSFTFSGIPPYWLTVAGICIFLGVMGKSAQFPLFHWLPDAMEGPTPVSALIHAATMVAAGVYLLIRIEVLFTPDSLIFISVIGCITALLGAWGALVQYDIKKILAFSTISQLGFMVTAIGSGAAQGGFMHLLHHAFFKAGLFLGTGAVIHALHSAQHHSANPFDVQDIRNLGGLRKKMPVTSITFLIFSAALIGLPFTAGFVSKELILTQTGNWVGDGFSWKWIIWISEWLLTLLTPLYTFRLVWYVFFSKSTIEPDITEVPMIMRLPLILLSIASTAFIISFNPFHISSFINLFYDAEPSTNHIITFVSLIFITLSLVFSYYFFRSRTLTSFKKSLSPQFYIDWLSYMTANRIVIISNWMHWLDRKVIDTVIHWFAYSQVALAYIIGWTDKYLVDGIVNGVAWSTKGIGSLTRSVVNGKIQSYLLWALACLIIFILWNLY